MIKTFSQISDCKVGNKHYFINHKAHETKISVKDVVIISEHDQPLHSFANNSVSKYELLEEWIEEFELKGNTKTRTHELREGFINNLRFLILITDDRIEKVKFTNDKYTAEQFLMV